MKAGATVFFVAVVCILASMLSVMIHGSVRRARREREE